MTAPLAEAVHELIGLVVGLGGAVGWFTPPPRAETDDWLAEVLAATAAGGGALCTAWRDSRLAAMGLWRREQAHFRRHSAELPNSLEVGDDRFDDVRMYRKLTVPGHLTLRGSAPSGLGYSPAARRSRAN